MANGKPIDTKREEFRKYLENAGVMDALTKVLVSLYEEPEKPEAALDYVITHLGGSLIDPQELETMKSDLQAAQERVQALEEENASLKEKLGVEGAEAAPEGEAPAEPEAAAEEPPAEEPPAEDAPAEAPPAEEPPAEEPPAEA